MKQEIAIFRQNIERKLIENQKELQEQKTNIAEMQACTAELEEHNAKASGLLAKLAKQTQQRQDKPTDLGARRFKVCYSVEWYKVFKEELIPTLQASNQLDSEENKIPLTWAEAIISIILKPGKDKDRCEGYLISILNIGYKMYTSIISKRIKPFIAELIDEDHTGLISGCQAQDSIQRTITNQAQKRKQSTVLVSINVEKAFECVNWEFLYEVLEQFGFNNKSVQLIKHYMKNRQLE